MARNGLFISFDYDNDRHYKNLLVAWDKNHLFDFTFNDRSVTVAVNSDEAGPIRRVISQRISDSPRFLCIIGKYTHRSRWVEWEIGKAKELRRRLIAVKTERDNTSPAGLLSSGATWALSFNFDAIRKAVEEA